MVYYMITDVVKLPSVIGSVVEYNVANVVARVRFPDDALLQRINSNCVTHDMYDVSIGTFRAIFPLLRFHGAIG